MYTSIMSYLKKCEQFGSIYGLERITELLARLDNPEKELKIIHTAGTNGKGSTNAFLNFALLENHYTTACYISPALDHYLEKFMVNDTSVDKETFVLCMSKVITQSKEIEKSALGHPTIFEMEMACAYLIAQMKKVDFFIQETGLGGRLDATNTITSPLLCIITSISKDHIDLLGNSLEAIAKEKAGIIKPNRPVILYDNEALNEIFINEAASKNAPVTICDFSKITYTPKEEHLVLIYDENHYPLGLRGIHQVKNAYLALLALVQLKEQGYNITNDCIKKGFEKTYWPGRFEQIANKPLIYLDGAHNEDSTRVLMENLSLYHKKATHIFIIHAFKDKDIQTMLKILKNKPSIVICTSIHLPRSLKAIELYTYASAVFENDTLYVKENLKDAITLAIEKSKQHSNSVISIFGSLSHLELSRKIVQEMVL